MGLYFIGGIPGTGKTSLMRELCSRDEEAHDTDAECIRYSKQTGKVLDYEESKNEDYNWIYPATSLQKLKQRSFSKNVFLLGSIDNFDEVNAAADEYIWMTLPLDMLPKRLDKRSKEYGKSTKDRQSIVQLHKEMNIMHQSKIFKLDGKKPVGEIADNLMKHVSSL